MSPPRPIFLRRRRWRALQRLAQLAGLAVAAGLVAGLVAWPLLSLLDR